MNPLDADALAALGVPLELPLPGGVIDPARVEAVLRRREGRQVPGQHYPCGCVHGSPCWVCGKPGTPSQVASLTCSGCHRPLCEGCWIVHGDNWQCRYLPARARDAIPLPLRRAPLPFVGCRDASCAAWDRG